jgi:hypothetical protein
MKGLIATAVAAVVAMGLWPHASAAQGAGAGLAGKADEGPIVVELYTAQGCASCPPADALLRELAARDDVLPLALHVDYWDYIGWRDSFARPDHTLRQKSYARATGARTIYTPQMIVGGVDQIVGSREIEVAALIAAHVQAARPVALEVARRGGLIEIRAEAREPLRGLVLVQLVRYEPERTISIDHGENAGRTITYVNIVTDWREIARWNGVEPLNITAEAPAGQPAAVILQEDGPGRIVGAAAVSR